MRTLIISFLVFFGSLFTACSSIENVPTSTEIKGSNVTKVPFYTPTPYLIPSTTTPIPIPPTSKPSNTPSATKLPTTQPTHTATPILIPWSQIEINSENIDQVEQLKVWGKGAVQKIEPMDGGMKIVVQTPFGVNVYSKADYEPLTFFENAVGFVTSPGAPTLALQYEGGIVEVVDGSSLDFVHRFEHETETPKYPSPDWDINDQLAIKTMSISQDGSLLAVGYGDRKINLYQLSDGSLFQVFDSLLAPDPNSLRFTPDGEYLLSYDWMKAAFWNIADGELISIVKGHGQLGDYPFSTDSTKMATSQDGGLVTIYSIPDGGLTFSFGTGERFVTVDFSKDGEYYLINGNEQVRSIQDGKRIPDEDADEVQHEAKDDVHFIAEQQWDLEHVGGMQKIWSAPETFSIWGSSGNNVYRWDVIEQVFSSYDLGSDVRWVGSLALSDNEDRIAVCANTGSKYNTLLVITTETGQVDAWGDCNGVIALSPDGHFVAKGNRALVDILETTGGELVHNMQGHTITPTYVDFSPDGKFLFSSSSSHSGGEMYLWRMQPPSMLKALTGEMGVISSNAFSTDRSLLITAGDRIRFWRIADGWQVKILPINSKSLAFSPDGSIIAIGATDGTIHLVEAPSGDEMGKLLGHRSTVVSIVFTEDGKNILSASADGTVRLWGIQP
jgi:WD40 repeat protein